MGDISEWISWYEERDPKSKRGKRFIEDMGLEEGSDFPMPDVADAEPLKAMLAREPYAPITAEYKRVSRDGKRRVNWYSLCGGPSNLKELARSLGQLDDYLVFYRPMSKTAHATDLRRLLTTTQDGKASAVTVVRSPVGMPSTYVWSINIGVEVTKAVMEQYRPGESTRFAKWYLDEVNPVATRLGQIEEEVA